MTFRVVETNLSLSALSWPTHEHGYTTGDIVRGTVLGVHAQFAEVFAVIGSQDNGRFFQEAHRF